MPDETNDIGRTMLAFSLGVLAGSVAALLLAPASGEETRRRIGGIASKVGERAKQTLDGAKEFVGSQKDRLGVAVDAGRQAYLRESSAAPMPGVRPDNI